MSEVKRFFTALGFDPEPYVDMIEDTDGTYVYYEDYETLRAQLSEAQKEIDRLKEAFDSALFQRREQKERAEKAEAELAEKERER